MNITIKTSGNLIYLESPYHPSLPKMARNIGGKWSSNNSLWVFDTRDMERVKDMCLQVYGTDGTSVPDLVDIRVTLTHDWWAHGESLFLCGRMIARAYGRDSGAKIGDGVIIISGKFTSGGSRKNWYTVGSNGTVFELRDVPRKALETIDPDIPLTWEIVRGEANNG